MNTKKNKISSFQDLIDSLEPIELDQLATDIPANVYAELLRIKHNVSAVLKFVGNENVLCNVDDRELLVALKTIRQECMLLHLTITKMLVFHFFRLDSVIESKYAAGTVLQYNNLAEKVCQLCQIMDPQFALRLNVAF